MKTRIGIVPASTVDGTRHDRRPGEITVACEVWSPKRTSKETSEEVFLVPTAFNSSQSSPPARIVILEIRSTATLSFGDFNIRCFRDAGPFIDNASELSTSRADPIARTCRLLTHWHKWLSAYSTHSRRPSSPDARGPWRASITLATYHTGGRFFANGSTASTILPSASHSGKSSAGGIKLTRSDITLPNVPSTSNCTVTRDSSTFVTTAE
mmetsp:Transcript_23097/g.63304  ORF Transcript_23097/g.63304 Transcript_23097/m.63304 type:complete len:211 (+) Transcript_23097:2639-3271(+)